MDCVIVNPLGYLEVVRADSPVVACCNPGDQRGRFVSPRVEFYGLYGRDFTSEDIQVWNEEIRSERELS